MTQRTHRQPDTMTPETWLAQARDGLRYALQPIVNIHTGCVYGYEALLRGVDRLGFDTVPALLEHAWRLGCAAELDCELRTLAIASFAALPEAARYRLFFNLDPQLIELEDPGHTLRLLEQHGLPPETVCFELSERADLTASPRVAEVIAAYRRHRFHLAIDDFGSGYAGLRLLYEHPPELLKIDRFFVSGIADDHKKRLFVASTVQLAHVMGIAVIAEGVETERELLACREVGCDLVQGYLVARPQTDHRALRTRYREIARVNASDRRRTDDDRSLIAACIEPIRPLPIDAEVGAMIETFRHDRVHHVLPVIDHAGRPLGLIHEADIKDVLYSNYGRELLLNRAFGRNLHDFLRPCPTVDIHDSAERLLGAYCADINPAGLILTRDARYHGFISATALLQLVEQKNLAAAREQNPLTRLPGNNPVYAYVSGALGERHRIWHLVYLDFDNFKAFNDHYGFRRGDRAILMFAELLRKLLGPEQWFIGHIGGDDFFAGIADVESGAVVHRIEQLLAKFRSDVQSLYDPEDRARGCILAHDRDGTPRRAGLMRCSAALLTIRPGDDHGSVEQLGQTIAELKHRAKASASGLFVGPHGSRHLRARHGKHPGRRRIGLLPNPYLPALN
ncbi:MULTISPECIES: GGDEF domain-containing protein [Marichromatium]|uniref:Diguanylate cyclase/phosphodiesterase n=1 Tax=Marichromatium gracile TaxID=1048 RepID=A0A4R4ACY7_MARGR|nr:MULTISPECIES: GGDEF domain-containing protein [Marichromatium]MBK1709464.1 GGDEF domain-containing protein [Marichromatium gracile]RNE91578.1 GGDEF domain-containing protein [Marichromatium sp. AB31]TCW36948.1 diguanylate cyclase/phosphodiesterase [Marichromatium gracile]